jgi:hypothetical protein
MLSLNTILQNRYRIIRQLGQGGMGTVYEALDQRVNASVALKETIVGDNEDARLAFEHEASLLANLRHQSLSKVMDYFIEDGGEYLVMEYISGDDLAQLLRERGAPFEVEQVLGWADEILKVLEYLHGRQYPILHRDIKPSNLKLNVQGELFLLDFGLAKGAAGQMPTLLTSKSVRGFTPVYSSFEQIYGKRTDTRSDLYSLGATLYHLLTNVPPVDAPTRFDALEDDKPDPLRPAHEFNPRVPPSVSAVIQQAMAVSRKNRPASATEMRHALRRAQEEAQQAAQEERQREAERKWQEEEERRRREEEEERQRRALAEEERRLAEEEAARKRAAEEEAARHREEEQRARAEEEARRRAAAEAREADRRRAEEILRRIEAEAQRRREEAEVEAAKRRRAEEAALRLATMRQLMEEEARQREAAEAERLRVEDEARQREEAEEQQRRKDEKRRKAIEEERRRVAAEVARIRGEWKEEERRRAAEHEQRDDEALDSVAAQPPPDAPTAIAPKTIASKNIALRSAQRTWDASPTDISVFFPLEDWSFMEDWSSMKVYRGRTSAAHAPATLYGPATPGDRNMRVIAIFSALLSGLVVITVIGLASMQRTGTGGTQPANENQATSAQSVATTGTPTPPALTANENVSSSNAQGAPATNLNANRSALNLNANRPGPESSPAQTGGTNLSPVQVEGSMATITSDAPLDDYMAYRSGNRYYVVIPQANAPALPGNIRGRGFDDVRVEKRGNDAVLSFRLKPGTSAHIEQRRNHLDVVFNSPPDNLQSNTASNANARTGP